MQVRKLLCVFLKLQTNGPSTKCSKQMTLMLTKPKSLQCEELKIDLASISIYLSIQTSIWVQTFFRIGIVLQI